ncbi:MAG: helix-turn-helix domain-containing protein [Sphingomonas sp.]|nr:helix-turn-helix domain-containing protein [Sphingomonas sp.]
MATAPEFEPVPLRPRHDGWSAERQIKFIEALAEGLTVEAAARRVGMTRDSAYRLYRRPGAGAFRRAWDAALDCNMPQLEQAAIERAKNGVARPIFYKGEQVGEWRHFDERLTMFLLRSRRPERYGKWIERRLPTDESDEEACAYDPDPGFRLDGPLTELEFHGPGAEGNLDDDDDKDIAPPSA